MNLTNSIDIEDYLDLMTLFGSPFYPIKVGGNWMEESWGTIWPDRPNIDEKILNYLGEWISSYFTPKDNWIRLDIDFFACDKNLRERLLNIYKEELIKYLGGLGFKVGLVTDKWGTYYKVIKTV